MFLPIPPRVLELQLVHFRPAIQLLAFLHLTLLPKFSQHPQLLVCLSLPANLPRFLLPPQEVFPANRRPLHRCSALLQQVFPANLRLLHRDLVPWLQVFPANHRLAFHILVSQALLENPKNRLQVSAFPQIRHLLQ